MYKTKRYIDSLDIECKQNKLAKIMGIARKSAAGLQFDSEGFWSCTGAAVSYVIAGALRALAADEVVVDGFGGIGGMTVGLAPYVGWVTLFEIDPERARMASHNLTTLRIHNTIALCADITHARIFGDAIIIDIPWGVDYRKHKSQRLSLGKLPLESLVASFAGKFKVYVVKLPVNYDHKFFAECMNMIGKIHYAYTFSPPNTCTVVIGSYF